MEDHFIGVDGQLADVHENLVDASTNATLGRNGLLTERGGYLIQEDD